MSQPDKGKGCIFCGGQPLTREHLWPNWLRKELGISEKWDLRIEGEVDGVETRDTSFSQPPFAQTVKAVCAECNGGWMSDIEAAAKPLLQQLVYGRGRRLHLGEQRILANWALLKACVFDEVHPLERVVPDAHRRYLYEHRQPPPDGLWIRLGTYAGDEVGHYAYQALDLGRKEPTVYFVTITVGMLLFQTSGSLLPEWEFDRVPFPPELGLVKIWPSSGGVELDQRKVLTHDTMVGLSQVLYNVVGKLSGGVPPPR